MNMNHTAEKPDRKPVFDINRVDYQWIEKTSNLKELRLAYQELEFDGCFPDLLKTLGKKIAELDPEFKKKITPEKKLSAAEEKKLNAEIYSFFDDMQKTDNQLRGIDTNEDQENQQIFANGQSRKPDDARKTKVVEEIEKGQMAANERLKGNEFMKSKEYREAVEAYSKSLELNSKEPFTFANRAMAHLKLKEFKNCIEDANKALELKPDYLKAYHRRGKAYHALKKYDEAIRDFQFILEQEPDNEGVNRDLKEARGAQTKQQDQKATTPTIEEIIEPEEEQPKEDKKKFVRVAIEEDSEEEDEEPKIEEVGAKKNFIESKFPLKTAKQIEAHTREAQILMRNGAKAFMDKFEKMKQSKEQVKIQEVPETPKVETPKTETPKTETQRTETPAARKIREEIEKAEKQAAEARAKQEQLLKEAKQAQQEYERAQKELNDAQKEKDKSAAALDKSTQNLKQEMKDKNMLDEYQA